MKTVVVIPTYNESQNIAALLQSILDLKIPGHEVEPLVVDDNSPDGTARIVREIAQRNPRVHLLLRTQNRGRGLAGIEGFQWALNAGAERVVEMDADFSHHPKYIPALLTALENADLASGSRFVEGGADDDRGFVRQAITKAAGVYIRFTLNLPLRDASSGFRAYKREVLEAIQLASFVSTGPSIVQEVFFRARQKRFKIVEVPIEFIDRKLGETKLNIRTLLRVLSMVLKLRVMHVKGELFRDEQARNAV